MDKKLLLELAAEDMIPMLKDHAQLFYNEGWDELLEVYNDDDIFNALVLNNISNIDDAILFFHYRFNPNSETAEA